MNLTTPRSSPDENQGQDVTIPQDSKEEIQKKSLQLKLNTLVRRVSVQTIILR